VHAARADQLEGPWFAGPGVFDWKETERPGEPLVDVTVTDLFPLAPVAGFIRLQIGSNP
jgi:hypothetical protein